MKKLIALMFAVALVAPAFALYDGFDSVTNGSAAVAYSTPCATPCVVKYIVVASTGSVTGDTVYFRDSTSAKVAVNMGTSAGTQIIDLSGCSVKFGTNLNYGGVTAETNYKVTIVYEGLLQ